MVGAAVPTWIPGRRRLRPTGLLWMLVAAGLVLLVAVRDALEPLSLLGGGLLALVGWASLAAHGASAHLEAALTGPVRTRVGARARVPVALRQAGTRRTARDLLLRSPASSGPLSGTAGVDQLAPGARIDLVLTTRLRRRGRPPSLEVELGTTHPLGLVEARVVFVLPGDVLVRPRTGRLRSLSALLGGPRPEGRPVRRRRRAEGEFFALREHRPGEGLAGVHWKHSARRGRLLVRELAAEDEGTVRVVLVALTLRPARGGPGAEFEEAVSLAATLVEASCAEGRATTLEVVGHGARSTRPGSGPRHARALTGHLATVECGAGDPRALVAGGIEARPGETVLVVYAGEGDALPAAPGLRLLDVLDPGIARHFRVFPTAEAGA